MIGTEVIASQRRIGGGTESETVWVTPIQFMKKVK